MKMFEPNLAYFFQGQVFGNSLFCNYLQTVEHTNVISGVHMFDLKAKARVKMEKNETLQMCVLDTRQMRIRTMLHKHPRSHKYKHTHTKAHSEIVGTSHQLKGKIC